MPLSQPFVLEESPAGLMLVVTGPWTALARRRLLQGDVDELVINYARGFAGEDLEFLGADLPVRSLRVLDRGIRDLAPIQRLSATLEGLSVEAAPTARLDLSGLNRLRTLAGAWSLIGPPMDSCQDLRSLITWSFPESTLLRLGRLRHLADLTVTDAPDLRSLGGIEAMHDLAGLRVLRAPRLEGIGSIRALSQLEDVQFENCPRLTTLEDLRHLRRLRILAFADCGPIDSLDPIGGLDGLEIVHLWGSTRILDGDLTPLTHLPGLRELRIRPRRAYRPAVTSLPAAVL